MKLIMKEQRQCGDKRVILKDEKTLMKKGLGYKKAKRIPHKRYNRLQHLWRNAKKYRVRKKNYSILCNVLEEKQ